MGTGADSLNLSSDRSQFADWLRVGLVRFYSSPRQPGPVFSKSTDDFIGKSESLAEDIETIYRRLIPIESQLAFRQSIGDVLRMTSNDVGNAWPLQATSDLISLVARLRAVEAIQALVPSIGTSALGEHAPTLLFEALSTLRYLAPAEGVFDTAYSLVCSANYDDGYLFGSLLILAECDPTRFAEVFFKLLPRVNQVRVGSLALGQHEIEAFDQAVQEFTDALQQFVPNNIFLELIESATWPSDSEWLLHRVWSSSYLNVLHATGPTKAVSPMARRQKLVRPEMPRFSDAYSACLEAVLAGRPTTLGQYNQELLKISVRTSASPKLKQETVSGITRKLPWILSNSQNYRSN